MTSVKTRGIQSWVFVPFQWNKDFQNSIKKLKKSYFLSYYFWDQNGWFFIELALKYQEENEHHVLIS